MQPVISASPPPIRLNTRHIQYTLDCSDEAHASYPILTPARCGWRVDMSRLVLEVGRAVDETCSESALISQSFKSLQRLRHCLQLQGQADTGFEFKNRSQKGRTTGS